LSDVAAIEVAPMIEGRVMTMVLIPSKPGKKTEAQAPAPVKP